MKKNYFIILERHSSDPIELRLSEANYLEEKYSIECDQNEDGQLIAGISAANLYAALGRAFELRDEAIESGEWDIISKNHKNSV
jgi:hypothetical protein